MKKLLLILAFGTMTASATTLVEGGMTASGQAAVESYNTLTMCMNDMAACLARIQDKETAAVEAPTLLLLGQRLKAMLDSMDAPYMVRKKATTTEDARALGNCSYYLRMAGLAVQEQMIRLAKEQFYHSEPLIKTFQELEMLGSDTDDLIR